MSTSLEKLNAKVLSEHLHSSFKVHADPSTPIVLELEEIKEGEPSPKVELFSIFFRGPEAPRLEQQIHRLEHEKLGTVELFLTAVASEPGKGILYESVFHRFRKPAA